MIPFTGYEIEENRPEGEENESSFKHFYLEAPVGNNNNNNHKPFIEQLLGAGPCTPFIVLLDCHNSSMK